ncbi:MAG: hypothetical protein ABI461_18770 [Polyangiaceae bacterium]
MGARVDALNEQSRSKAMQELQKQGYSPIEASSYRAQASTTPEGARRCSLESLQAYPANAAS